MSLPGQPRIELEILIGRHGAPRGGTPGVFQMRPNRDWKTSGASSIDRMVRNLESVQKRFAKLIIPKCRSRGVQDLTRTENRSSLSRVQYRASNRNKVFDDLWMAPY